MRLSMRPSAELVAWASERIDALHGQGFPEPATAMGIESEAGDLLGVVVFHDYQPAFGTMQVSAISEDARWLRARNAWRMMFRYAFEVCGVQKLYSLTPASNKRALRFVLNGLKFKAEAVLQRQFGDDDAIMSCFFREWFESEQTEAAAAA